MGKLKENRCQCCSAELNGEIHLVFDDEGKRLNIATLLIDHIGKHLNENDGTKYGICGQCWLQLIKFQEFRRKCIQANTVAIDDVGNGIEKQIEQITPNSLFDHNRFERIDKGECNNDGGGGEQSLTTADTFPENEVEHMKIDYLDEMFEFNDIVETGSTAAVAIKNVNDPTTVMKLKSGEKLPYDFSQILVKPILPWNINCLDDLVRAKRNIQNGIPRHVSESKTDEDIYNQNLDVNKIVTSNDLIEILEDDYRNENNQRTGGNRFKLLAKDCSDTEIEYLDEYKPINIDKYLKSIATFDYSESYEPYVNCKLCSKAIISQQHLVYHVKDCHSIDEGVLCIFDENCPVLDDLITAQEHIFHQHLDLIPTQTILTCTTCDGVFKSPVQFGKHMCLVLDDESTDFQCLTCDKRLQSRKRYLFHIQFHLDNARPKVCIICDIVFQSEESFYNHVMFMHERIFEHFCQDCDKSFASKNRLDHHKRHQHTKKPVSSRESVTESPPTNGTNTAVANIRAANKTPQNQRIFSCTVCEKVYNRASRLRKHATTHETPQRNSVLICEQCSIAFATIEDVEQHCNRIHDDIDTNIDDVNIISKEILFVVCCEYCECAFVDNKRLAQHKKRHANEDKPFKCEYCMASYETYSKLKTHKNSHINQQIAFPVQRNYMCDVNECYKCYRHWSDLMNHRKTVHLLNPSIYKCTECEATFYKSWDFNYHKKTIHSISIFKCDVCGLEYRWQYTLKLHMKKCHSSDGNVAIVQRAKPSSKSIESKRSKRMLDFDAYMRQSGDRSFVCNVCEKQLASRNSAKSHIEMIHRKKINHTCEICGKGYYLRKDYNDHVRRHTAEQPYECSMCTKKFRTASMLSGHRRSHSNNRPHRCPYCVSTFKRAYVLKNHIKQHIGVKGFLCKAENCTKEYRTQWELNNHQRRKHTESNINDDRSRAASNLTAQQKLSSSVTENHPTTNSDRPSAQIDEPSKGTTFQMEQCESNNDENIIYFLADDEIPESRLTAIDQNHHIAAVFDHNYVPVRNESTEDSSVIYIFDQTLPILHENRTKSTGLYIGQPSTIFLANQNQSTSLTTMDAINNIPTYDQDIQTIIF